MVEGSSNADDVFNIERIRRLIELMESHDLREIDLRQGEEQIRLCRGGVPVMAAAPAAVPVAPPVPPVASSPAPEEQLHIIRSPMVGTFYTRSNPSAEPFVKVGSVVDATTTVCIIEAMKVFNEIPAEVRGRIVAILVDDEEPVDFGKPLFKVDTQAS